MAICYDSWLGKGAFPVTEGKREEMFLGTFLSIVRDNWEWRKQIGHLAVFELKKRARGAVLGWIWLLIKPLIYILVFWFALEVGLRAGSGQTGNYPYFLWLISGLVPWFFMSDMINTGSDALHRYPYLVNKVKFPLSCVSSIYTLSALFISLFMFVILIVAYFLYGMPVDLYLIQVPILIVVMFAFWDMFSVMTSMVSGVSKDFAQLMKALSQPFFWLSGVIFNMSLLADHGFGWVVNLMYFNPVTFFCGAFRDALCYKQWVWENPWALGGFLVMLVGTAILMVVVYKRFHDEVADVL